MYRQIVIIFFCLSIISCDYLIPDIPFSIKKSPQNSHKLKLEGYYYSLNFDKTQIGTVYFFYQDGVLLHGMDNYVGTLSQRENDFSAGTYYQNTKEKRRNWGVFQIKKDSIIFQKYFPASCCGEGFLPVELKGVIINDTTFIITHSNQLGKLLEKVNIESKFSFKKLKPKPDSLNTFVN